MNPLHLLLFLVLTASLAVAQTRDIKELGAIGDGKKVNTQVIQRAVDECAAAGGGEVRVPAGVFVTGTVHLKSHVTLRLMPGAVMQGSQDAADYPEHDISRHQKFGTITHDGVFVKGMKSLIIADGAENGSIVGEGAINGAGEVPWVSSFGSDFNADFHVSFTPAEMAQGKVDYNYTQQEFPSDEAPGASVFARDADGEIFHTYSTYGRGLEVFLGTYMALDLVPKGRDEDALAFSMEWVRYHDRYGTDQFADASKPYWPEEANPSSSTCGCGTTEAHA